MARPKEKRIFVLVVMLPDMSVPSRGSWSVRRTKLRRAVAPVAPGRATGCRRCRYGTLEDLDMGRSSRSPSTHGSEVAHQAVGLAFRRARAGDRLWVVA